MIRIRNVALGLLLVGVVAACGTTGSSGGSSQPTTSGSGSPSAGGHNVTIKNFAFSPASLTVKVGTKVTFTNEDNTQHTASSTGTKTIDSGTLNKGQSYTVTFTKPGTYSYICNFHNYMKGTVTVQ